MINRDSLNDDGTRYETVRELRWAAGVKCPSCGSAAIPKRGRDERPKTGNGMRGGACHRQFDDSSGRVLKDLTKRGSCACTSGAYRISKSRQNWR